jgi:diadenosine tetraphosphate (Ap4A) HIT family hydrolase
MSELKAFKEKFNIQDYTIYETDHWIWSLRPLQGTVGAGVLSLKRPCLVLSEVSRDEFADLDQMIKVIEGTLKRTFDYDIMNYLMLMMVDKQVHYHVFPRYEQTVTLKDKSYTDRNWPKPPELAGEALDSEEMTAIYNEIKKNLGAS